MVKLTERQIKKYLTFLEEYKSLVGFDGWITGLDTKTSDMEAGLAQVLIDIYEKTIKVILSNDFLAKPKNEQAHILFHELVHSRISVVRERIMEHHKIEEEHMVNDIVRGFEQYGKFEL